MANKKVLTSTGLARAFALIAGKYAEKTDIPENVSELANDAGYITGTTWDDVTNKPDSFTPDTHTQTADTINAMTGYAKPETTSAIATADSLNTAIGKLETALDNKLAVNGTAAKASADASGNDIETTYATKAELSRIPKLNVAVVEALPTENIDEETIYLVLSANGAGQNLYTEYLYINDTWEKLGEQSSDIDLAGYMPKAGGTFTGAITAPTPTTGDNSTNVATTEFVQNAMDTYVPDINEIANADIAAAWDNIDPDTSIITYAPLASPNLTGTPTAPTPNSNDNSIQIATTEFVQNIKNDEVIRADGKYLPLAGGTMTGMITSSADPVLRSNSDVDGSIRLIGGNTDMKGARLGLGSEGVGGDFTLVTDDGTNSSKLTGTPELLSWNGTIAIDHNNNTNLAPGIKFTGENQHFILSASDTGVKKGTVPTETHYWGINFYGQDMASYKNRIGMLETTLNADNLSSTCIYAYNCTTNDNNATAAIGVHVNADGLAYTSAPTPAQTDDSTKIATTAYVKDCVPKSIGAASTAVYTNADGVITKGNAFVPTSGGTFSGTVYFTRSTDAGATSTTMPAVVIGGAAAAKHIAIDNDEIMAVGADHAVGTLYINNDGGSVYIGKAAGGLSCNGSSAVFPRTNKTIALGASSYLWKQLYATTATISTSDEREKQLINNIPNEILDAWSDVDWYQFKFNDAVAEKGSDKARLHTGLVAQRIDRIFKERNLDVTNYGLFCYDEWDAKEAVYSDNGKLLEEPLEAGNAYAIRYEEALALEAAWQRRENKKLRAQINELEERLSKLEEQ